MRLLVLVASLAAALIAATGASALPNRFDMGIYDPAANQVGGSAGYAFLSPDVAMRHTARTGSRFVRIPVRWDRITCGDKKWACDQDDRPTAPRDPDDEAYEWVRPGWYAHDAEVAEALANDLEPILSVFGAPAWAQCNGTANRAASANQAAGVLDCTGDPDQSNFRPEVQDFKDFMVAVREKYPRVKYFQVWNEPNQSFFLKPSLAKETIDRYRDLVNAAYDVLAPHGKFVIAGGTSPNPRSTGNLAFSPKEFLRKVASKRVDFHAWDTHPYTPGGPRTKAPASSGAVWMGNLGELGAILKKSKKGGKVKRGAQYWVTEFGWDSAPPDCRRGERTQGGQTFSVRATPTALLTRWVSESAYRMWRQGVRVMVWHQLKDFPAAENPFQGGLFYEAGEDVVGTPKPALQAFKFPFVAYKRKGGLYVWGRHPESRPGRIAIQKQVRGTWKPVRKVGTFGPGGLFQKQLSLSTRRIKAFRARAGNTYSARFNLKAPRVPSGIQPFGCTSMDQWR